MHLLTGLHLLVGMPALAAPAPHGGCPMPPNSVVITEISTGPAAAPRWVELRNPGTYSISLNKVYLVVDDLPSDPEFAPSWNLGALLPELPAGESVAFGHVPANLSNPATVLLKLKVVDLGASFSLPPCKGKIAIDGPAGIVDDVEYVVCLGSGEVKPALYGLEPQLTDICKNDKCQAGSGPWCVQPGEAAATGTPGKTNAPCDLDGDGYTSAAGDCNDQSKAVFPGALEVCNGQDDDCNGQTDDDLTLPPGQCLSLGVCKGPQVVKCDGKEGFTCNYPPGFESVAETVCDNLDNDCDGQTDEGLRNACGACGPVPVEVCNDLDDDCDGNTDEDVSLAPGACGAAGVCALAKGQCGPDGLPQCALPPAWQATETACDLQDNDCDGQTDEGLGVGNPCQAGVGKCAVVGAWACGAGGAKVCKGVPRLPAPAELCGNAVDDDCDGQTDESFDLGATCQVGVGMCRVTGKVVCGANRLGAACGVQPLKPAATEACGNRFDDDCDGATDEAGCTGVVDDGCGASRRPPEPWGLGGGLAAVCCAVAIGWRVCRRRWPG
ncbi:MAG: hypothetical protein EXR79_07880 [Myxococcales bacterium]|nr:hypothetical protein [Myxococcales bacterium]